MFFFLVKKKYLQIWLSSLASILLQVYSDMGFKTLKSVCMCACSVCIDRWPYIYRDIKSYIDYLIGSLLNLQISVYRGYTCTAK